MFRLILTIVFCTQLSAHAFAESKKEELIARNIKDTASPEASKEEARLAGSFFGPDLEYLKKCVPENEKIERFEVFFEILPSGSLGEIFMDPENEVTQCLREAAKNQTFEPRSKPFVVHIDMKIED